MASPTPATVSQMQDPESSQQVKMQEEEESSPTKMDAKDEQAQPPKMESVDDPAQPPVIESVDELAQPTASSSFLAKTDAGEAAPTEPPAETSVQAQEDSSAPSPPPKRQRKQSAADTGRGRRMFGLLNATLGKAKRESEARGDQAKRRAEIEQRQKDRLEAQREEIDRQEVHRRLMSGKYHREIELCEMILAGEASHRSIRASKRRLASFLVTSSGGGERRASRQKSRSGNVIAANVPCSLAPLPPDEHRDKAYPIYFLPKVLTAEQEDMLDEQEDQVDAEIELADADWQRRKQELSEQLDAVRRDIESVNAEGEGVQSKDTVMAT